MKHTLAFVDSISQNISEGHYLGICNALKKDYDEQQPSDIPIDVVIDLQSRLNLEIRDNNKKQLEGMVKGFYDALGFMFVEPSDSKEFFIEYLTTKLMLSPTVINKFVKKYF